MGRGHSARGKIDSSDYKHYIFGLFYKHICDVWQEEFEKRMDFYHDAEATPTGMSTARHPEGALERRPQESTDIGQGLNTWRSRIEDANPLAQGVFQTSTSTTRSASDETSSCRCAALRSTATTRMSRPMPVTPIST
ncbi:MAG: hypothetical protein H6509_15810 [Bryobacterales bacterium]|nr:hypothetical protein [Bryobacterales bacterium]